MLDYQQTAINTVRELAKTKSLEHQIYVEEICNSYNVNLHSLIDRVLHNPITINFHPDRLSNNGKTIIENLFDQGQYYSQFRTGTTNGGRTAYIDGERFAWEQRLFCNAYPNNAIERPKYGALNIFRYLDGASARFGSCFFVLKNEITKRCTFSYGDSSTNPTTLCTSDTFICVLSELFKDVQQNNRLLNQVVSSNQETLAILLNDSNKMKNLGRNLDYCIETHIHGDISLSKDVSCFYIDESFHQTAFAKLAELLCQKYEITLHWISKRQISVDEIGVFFRSPKIPIVARRIDSILGKNQGIINAALIGEASRDSLIHPEAWQDIGDESELFQYFKQLWHTVAYFG